MVTQSVDAFVRRDVDLARSITKQDDLVDEDFSNVKQALISAIAREPGQGEVALDLLMIAKYFERMVLFDSQADESSMENHAQREEVRQALETGEGQSSRYSSTLLEKTIYYAKRLTDGSILRISISRATAGVLVMGMLQPMLVVLAAALILALVLAKRISARIVAPLNRLDLEKPLENDTYEELSPLLTRINQQRRQIDAQLRTLQQKKDEFDQITASMNEGLVLMNEKGTVLSINPAARELFHAEPDCVGQDFLTVERSHEISCAIRRALEEGHAELRVERGGREYQLDISRIESEGTVIGAVLLAFDVTEQAFAERNRREFTANVSHELKTPLQSIMGSAELIENGLVKQEDMPRFVGHIRTEAARLVTLIEDIIRLSQLDEGGELPFEPVDLKKLAEEASASLASAAAEKKAGHDPRPWRRQADHDRPQACFGDHL